MKINEFEEQHLRELYTIANEMDTDQSWKDVRDYYNELGEIYGFDPRRVMISTNGTISNRSFTTIYIIVDTLKGLPVEAFYDKKTAEDLASKGKDYIVEPVGLN
jgi:hypothetical protein